MIEVSVDSQNLWYFFFRKFEHLEINLGRSIRWNCRYYTVFFFFFFFFFFAGSAFAERFSGEGQADFAINKADKVSLKGRNNLYISCVFNGFKYTFFFIFALVTLHIVSVA